jgi:hypothetical protein
VVVFSFSPLVASEEKNNVLTTPPSRRHGGGGGGRPPLPSIIARRELVVQRYAEDPVVDVGVGVVVPPPSFATVM